MRFVAENYGDSELAKRFGVTRYPAIFVDDVLVATPKDFGFYGKGEGGEEGGRYAPLKSVASHERFRADLTRILQLVLSGHTDAARAEAHPAKDEGIRLLPDVAFRALDGTTLTRTSLAGKVVVVELWATWCPPCRSTLGWLGELRKRYGDRLSVIAVAVDSDEANVRKIASEMELPVHWVMATPEVVRSLGDVSAVPTLLLFDGKGQAAGAYFGAAPTLHADVEGRVASALP